ncbi:hypothetical protein SEVIR_3G275201v4 [Setaria viridis]
MRPLAKIRFMLLMEKVYMVISNVGKNYFSYHQCASWSHAVTKILIFVHQFTSDNDVLRIWAQRIFFFKVDVKMDFILGRKPLKFTMLRLPVCLVLDLSFLVLFVN